MSVRFIVRGKVHMPRNPLDGEVDNTSVARFECAAFSASISEFSRVLHLVLLGLKIFDCCVNVVEEILSWF